MSDEAIPTVAPDDPSDLVVVSNSAPNPQELLDARADLAREPRILDRFETDPGG